MLGWLRNRRPKGSESPGPPPNDAWDEVTARVREQAEMRRRELVGQEHLVAEAEALLFRHDPIGLDFEDNTDEYRAEAETITLRRHEADSIAEFRTIVHQEFCHWFGAGVAGPEEKYEAIARDLWELWSERDEQHAPD